MGVKANWREARQLAAMATSQILLTLLICTVGALMVWRGIIQEENGANAALLAVFLTTFLTTRTMLKKWEKNRLAAVILSSAVYMIMLLGMHLAFREVKFERAGITAALILVGGMLSLFVSKRGRRKSRGMMTGKRQIVKIHKNATRVK